MKLIEYLNKISNDGTSVILPMETHRQEMITTNRDEFGNGYQVIRYTSESLAEGKAEEKLLKTITSAVLNCTDVASWWNYCKKVCSKQYESGAVDADVQELYGTLLTTLSIRLSDMTLTERHFSSARTLLTILGTRIKAWQKEAKVDVEKASDTNITFSITGF